MFRKFELETFKQNINSENKRKFWGFGMSKRGFKIAIFPKVFHK